MIDSGEKPSFLEPAGVELQPKRVDSESAREGMGERALKAVGGVAGDDHEQRAVLPVDYPQGFDILPYERLFDGVIDRFSASTPARRAALESTSQKRWASLNQALGDELGDSFKGLNSNEVVALLIEYVEAYPTRGQDRLPTEHKAVFAVMLWKHLQGATTSSIESITRAEVPSTVGSHIRSVQTRFVRFAAGRLGAVYPDPSKARKKPVKDPLRVSDSDKVTNELRRLRDARKKDMRHRLPEVVDTTDTKALLADQISLALGGNVGAYRQMFDLPVKAGVQPEENGEARQKLWAAVDQNIQERKTTDTNPRLNNSEIKWVALLCGKKLVPDPETKKLSICDGPPYTLSGIKVLAQIAHSKGSVFTPDDAERAIYDAFQKIIDSRSTR